MTSNYAAEYKMFVELYGAAIRRASSDPNAIDDPMVEAIICSIPAEFDIHYEMYLRELEERETRASAR